MSISLSLYDFFAYTLPGGLYLFAIIHGSVILGLATATNFKSLDSLAPTEIAVLAGVTYLLGIAFDKLATEWHYLFKGRKFADRVFAEYAANNPHLELKVQSRDWPVMLAYIRRESLEVAADIERVNASRIMMRNISLGLALLTLIQVVQSIKTSSLLAELLLMIAFGIGSFIFIRQATAFQEGFYQKIYEAIVARNITAASDLIAIKPKPISLESTEYQ